MNSKSWVWAHSISVRLGIAMALMLLSSVVLIVRNLTPARDVEEKLATVDVLRTELTDCHQLTTLLDQISDSPPTDQPALTEAARRVLSDLEMRIQSEVTGSAALGLKPEDDPLQRPVLERRRQAAATVIRPSLDQLVGAPSVTQQEVSALESALQALTKDIDESMTIETEQTRATIQGHLYGEYSSALLVCIVLAVVMHTSRRVVRSAQTLSNAANAVAEGDLNVVVPCDGADEMTRVGHAFNHMVAELCARMLEESERKRLRDTLESIFRLSPDVLIVAGLDGDIKEVSPAIETTLGYAPSEAVGMGLLQLIDQDDRSAVDSGLQQLRSRELHLVNLELRSRAQDGKPRWFLWTFILSTTEQQLYAIGRDLSERRSIEEQLRQSQKMDAMGRLAGGIAHDFNNLLTVINGYSDLLLLAVQAGESIRADELMDIRDAGERAAALTHQLLVFSRKQPMCLQVVSVNDVVTSTERMLRRLLDESIELRTELAPQLGLVKADPGQIEQVLVNLAVNARDAMAVGGRLTLRTANVDLDDTYVSQHAGMLEPGPYVLLLVSDNGEGMTADTQARIFEPFFTTKQEGKGTGLGLSTVFGIVKRFGGHITVYSDPGQGTTFRMYLPRTTESATSPRRQRPSAVAERGTETLLLVEDDIQVRELAIILLCRQGYQVLAAGDGAEALRFCQHGPIQLLITDLVLPDMTGLKIAELAVALLPGLRVLYMSGYMESLVTLQPDIDAGRFFMEKPFTRDTLLSRVREALS